MPGHSLNTDGTRTHRYDVFISYSHAGDAQLAKALKRSLERFAKPWYRLRSVNVFRDETALSVSPQLWKSIGQNLDASAHLIILASRTGAASKWVRKELCYWITGGACDEPTALQRSHIRPDRVERMLIVLTEGEIAWDDGALDFDWSRTTALPKEVLSGAYAGEPLWVDLRPVRNSPRLDPTNEVFIQAVAKLSAPIRGLDYESLISEDRRQHRRSMRHALTAIVALAILAIGVAFFATGFYRQWRIAEQRATDLTVADGYQLIQLGSEQLASGKPEQAAASFSASQRTFVQARHNPLMSWYRRLAADLATLSKEQLFQTRHGYNIAGLHVSDDGALVALEFDYNEVPAKELKAAPGIEVWDTASRQLVLTWPALSDIGKLVCGFSSRERDITNQPDKLIEAILPPCDLVLRGKGKGPERRERLSLRDGSLTPYVWKTSAEDGRHLAELERLALHVELRYTTLEFQPRHARGSVSFSGFFKQNPATGNDVVNDPFRERPDQLWAESFDGARLLIGTYEGTIALFECYQYGTQLKRGRIGPIRGVKFIGKSRVAIAVDENGSVWRLSEDHPAMVRTGLKKVSRLAFSADRSVLATVSGSMMAAYDVDNRQVIAQHSFGQPQEPLAFGHGTRRRAAYAFCANGELRSLEYGGSDSPSCNAVILPQGDHENVSKRFIRACFDFDRELVWVASAHPDKDNVSVAAYSLTDTRSPVHSHTLSLGRISELSAMACRGNEVVLFAVAKQAPGIGKSINEATVLVRFRSDGTDEPSFAWVFKPGMERFDDNVASRVPNVKRVLETPLGEPLFVEIGTAFGSGSYPLSTPMELAQHRFVSAEAISRCRDGGANLGIAVTTERSGIGLYIEDPGRDLSYQMLLPVVGFLRCCAIGRDGRLVALATTEEEDAVLIDLGVFSE
jgi:hypothetical protein